MMQKFLDVLAISLMVFVLCAVIIPFVVENLAFCGAAVSVAIMVKSIVSQSRLKVSENE